MHFGTVAGRKDAPPTGNKEKIRRAGLRASLQVKRVR